MGAKCCTDRKVTNGANGAASSAAGSSGGGGEGAEKGSPSAKPERKSVHASNAYDNKKRAISIGYQSKGDDAEKFDKAFETNDLKTFVALLSSQQPIESFEERMHPWAEDPKTVGALAGTQLAILASVADKDNPKVKDEIREAGGIPPLVDFLRSDQEDRIQTSVVALSFLTAECPANTAAIYEADAMALLLTHLDSKIAGMRAAAATTLRNICMEDDLYRKKFVELGGIKGLVEQLGAEPHPSLNWADVQLEAVLNLEDLIENEDGSLIEDYARQAIEAGAEKRLEELKKSDDEEVRGAAQEVLAALESIKAPKP